MPTLPAPDPASSADPRSPVRLFCSDLDGTLLGNPESTARFAAAWHHLPSKRRPALCYATGRLVEDALQVVADQSLPEPDFLIGGVGTQLYDSSRKHHVPDFEARFSRDWDSALVERIVSAQPGMTAQPPQFIHPYKSSWYWPGATAENVAELRRQLQEAGVEANVVFSSQRDLDVLPAAADKGLALTWLCERLGIELAEVVVSGDTGNDISLFRLPGVRGIVVENALPELLESLVGLPVHRARLPLADGVVEGLQHHGVFPKELRSNESGVSPPPVAHPLRAIIADEAFQTLTQAERELVATGYEKAVEALRRNITPRGFSACSIEDNPSVGTDANYHSVWARDGMITLLGSIDLDAPDIREAQRATLITLLDHIRPGGQPPANVRVADGVPDYSGIGGICAIDSGLWILIALNRWVCVTGEIDLARRYHSKLKRLFTWLEAQDSNGDGLLEVPEAGDWTDLFGRSYHVLYDEVLWYRAIEATASLEEILGHPKRAAELYRQAQHVRSRILHVFWPTTHAQASDGTGSVSFADSQFSIGDSRYLLAEITPFHFSWRCDILGNVMASLANILDVERSRTAFRFMWGVGANDPFPVANLYPPVQAGDPEWRPYYTVNLLNLPDHYHNGGLWPFIGGMWVRFLKRLGLQDVACRELVKLAELNKLGQKQEWEFTEWAHGRTGRPMGKAFQAWSASSYIHACHELQLAGTEGTA